MPVSLPYLASPGLIDRVLEKIVEARRPERFTRDFLETKLGMTGGSAAALIPFLKRLGFLAQDGTPTVLYDRFRNSQSQGVAMATAMKQAYKDLYDANEYVHDLSPEKLRALITQLTGAEKDARTTQLTVQAFANLKKWSDFDVLLKPESNDDVFAADQKPTDNGMPTLQSAPPNLAPARQHEVDLRLAYTINLNLPESTNPEVFNAIFKALRENLLTGDK